MQYPIDRFTMEIKRQLDVLNRTLAEREFLCGDDTRADIANYSWYGQLVINNLTAPKSLLSGVPIPPAVRWANRIQARPAVDRPSSRKSPLGSRGDPRDRATQRGRLQISTS